MASKELTLEILRGTTPLAEIPDVPVQQFCLFLRKKFPSATILYEPTTFTFTDSSGKKRQTTPDVFFRKSDNEPGIFIEITTLPKNGTDPKKKQREVMAANPQIKYVVLYRENLARIEASARKKRIDISFFNARKIRR